MFFPQTFVKREFQAIQKSLTHFFVPMLLTPHLLTSGFGAEGQIEIYTFFCIKFALKFEWQPNWHDY